MTGVVAVMALVDGLCSKKVSSRARGCSGSLALPVDSWGVVVAVVDGPFPDVHMLGYYVVLGYGSCQL
jgi:hypothetical protein